MEHIYIALVDTPGFFARLIRMVIKQKYIHVVLSMDAELNETYSVGRRNPFVPIIAGFEKEEKYQINRAFPTAQYMICELDCTAEQKVRIFARLRADFAQRHRFHYAIIGLPFIMLNRPFYQRNHYTCSSYIARVLEENGISIVDKHFSLVTPKDFYHFQNKRVIYEGALEDILESSVPV